MPKRKRVRNGIAAFFQVVFGLIALVFMGSLVFGLGKCVGPDEPPTHEELEQIEANLIAKKQAGRHCLSGWDGRHIRLAENFKNTLRDPSSFEHAKTIIAPIDENGKHALMMRYRAKNGFGGMTQGHVQAEIDNESCAFQIIATD